MFIFLVENKKYITYRNSTQPNADYFWNFSGFFWAIFFFCKKKILTKIRRSNAQINKFVIQIIQVYASWKGTYIRPIFDSIKKPRYEMSAFATFMSFSAEIVGKPREVAIWNKCSCTRYYYCLFYRPWTFMVKKKKRNYNNWFCCWMLWMQYKSVIGFL